MDPTTLAGDAVFTGLEARPSGMHPSGGAGIQWGSGRLELKYGVTIA